MPDYLSSPQLYETFIYTLQERYPSIEQSTLVYIPSGTLYGKVEGFVFFPRNIVLCVQEYLNFELGLIEGYGYEVTRSPKAHTEPDFPSVGSLGICSQSGTWLVKNSLKCFLIVCSLMSKTN